MEQIQRMLGFSVALLALLGLAACSSVPLPPDSQLLSWNENVHFHDLHCSENGHIVVTGNMGAITGDAFVLHSKDRGATWRRSSIDPPTIRGPQTIISLPDSKGGTELLISGYGYGLFFTEVGPWWSSIDGGVTWLHAEPRLPLSSAAGWPEFLPKIIRADESGTLVAIAHESYDVAVLRSIDGGMRWDKKILQKLRFYGEILSDDRGHLTASGGRDPEFMGSPNGVIYWSSDAGISWQQSEGDELEVFKGNLKLYRTPSGTRIAFGASSGKGNPTQVYYSLDEGRTWSKSHGLGRSGAVRGMSGNSKGLTVAITEINQVLLSHDGGVSWRIGSHLTAGNVRHADTAEVVVSEDGVVVAMLDWIDIIRGKDYAAILRSTDQGETWSTIDTQLPGSRRQCSDGKGLIVALGWGGGIFQSTDWGATWKQGQMDDTVRVK